MSDKMREAFESWCRDEWLGGGELFKDKKLARRDSGMYVDSEVNFAWNAYQSALTQQPEIEPDVWLFPDRVWSELSSVEIGRNGMGAFLCPHLSAQVPEGWSVKYEPDKFLLKVETPDKRLAILHDIPECDYTDRIFLEFVRDFLAVAPSIAEKREPKS